MTTTTAGLPTRESHRRITRQTLWMAAVTIVEVLGALVHVFIAARLLGLEGYGALAIIIATCTLIHGLVAIQGGDTVTTFATRSITEGHPEEAASILRFAATVSLGLSLVAYAAIAVLTVTASGLLRIDGPHVSAMLLYGAVGVLLATKTEALAVLRLADRLRASLVISVADNVTRIAALVVVWFVGGGLLAVVSATVAGAVVSLVGLSLAAVIVADRAGFSGLFRTASLWVAPDVIRFHLGTFGRTTIGALTQNLDTVLVAQLVGTGDVGLYRAARQITDMARRPFQLVRFGVQPELSRQWYSREGSALRHTVTRFTVYTLVLAVLGYGILGVFREPISLLVLGQDFEGVERLLLILIPGAFVASISVLGVLPVATGRVWPSLASTTAELVVAVVSIALLVPILASEGAAWARTAATITAVVVLVPFAVSILRQSTNLRPGQGLMAEQK